MPPWASRPARHHPSRPHQLAHPAPHPSPAHTLGSFLLVLWHAGCKYSRPIQVDWTVEEPAVKKGTMGEGEEQMQAEKGVALTGLSGARLLA